MGIIFAPKGHSNHWPRKLEMGRFIQKKEHVLGVACMG
jgi:hypothetical protein